MYVANYTEDMSTDIVGLQVISPKLELCENPISDSRDVTCEQTDGELIGAF
jgi:hypothetical protein